MDDELKRYLDGIAANIATAMRAMENRIMSALKSTEVRLDAEARPLDTGSTRMEQGRSGSRCGATGSNISV